jgi:hypothetical protein
MILLSGTPGFLVQTARGSNQFCRAAARRRAETALHLISTRQSWRTFMDKFWSIFSMPIGMVLCFAPGIIVWWLTKDKASPADDGDEQH